jgi:hypothetical protein
MDQELSKFEQESTKTPVWLPIMGVVVFFLVVVLAVLFPGSSPTVPDGGHAEQAASE